MRSSSNKYNLVIKAVLEKELYTTPPLMPVVIARITGTKNDIPRAFKSIEAELIPSADIKHLRRIKSLKDGQMDCIICRLRCNDKDNKILDTELKKIESKFSNQNIFTNYRIAYVPSKAPRTHHQLKACSEIWPCKFAKCNYLISCIQGSIFNEAERIVLKIIVNRVLGYIRNNNNSDRSPSSSSSSSSNSKTVKSVAVIFRCAKIYGIGFSSSKIIAQNPIQHSTMAAIDSVASNASGGHWKCLCRNSYELHSSLQNELDNRKELKDHRIDANFLPYLCTNYDLFVTEEPCFMCTMGLVQSRIRRLFFLDKESIKLANCNQLCYGDKAIEDYLVHREKNLNHRFEAWRVSLVGSSTSSNSDGGSSGGSGSNSSGEDEKKNIE